MVRVSIRVRGLGLPPVLSLFVRWCGLFRFRSRYLCAIGLRVYLALDASTTRSRCTTKQRYSFPARARGSHPLRPPFPWRSAHAPQRPRAYHWGCFLFGRPYSGNPRLFLLLALVICLSPGRVRARCAPFGTRPLPGAFRVLRVRRRLRSQSVPYGSSLAACSVPQQAHCAARRAPAGPLPRRVVVVVPCSRHCLGLRGGVSVLPCDSSSKVAC